MEGSAMTDIADPVPSFAHGSTMASGYLRETRPSAEAVGPAVLSKARIHFGRRSTDLDGGICTIQPAPGESAGDDAKDHQWQLFARTLTARWSAASGSGG